jgi:hypothetical protein
MSRIASRATRVAMNPPHGHHGSVVGPTGSDRRTSTEDARSEQMEHR